QPHVAAEGFRSEAGFEMRETLLARTLFSCGPQCTFYRPVYSGGDAEVGKETFLDSIFAEGNLILGPRAEVRDWAACGGILHLRHHAWIGGVARAGYAIILGGEATAFALDAPEISTQGREYGAASNPGWAPELVRQVHPPGRDLKPPDLPGADARQWRALDAQTWMYDGALVLEAPVWLRAHLRTRGAFACPAGSLLDCDLASGGSVRIGPASVCGRDVRANGDLVLESDVIFQGELDSERTIRLRSGVRGFRQDGPVLSRSKGSTLLEPNVVVRGRVEARGLVRAL
ncbi:MAG: hypothetical protein ACRD44_10785, partial [Bryobacteraceae bacterium]